MSTPGSVIISLARRDILTKEKALLAHPKVGGLVLFSENAFISAEEDLKALFMEIRLRIPNDQLEQNTFYKELSNNISSDKIQARKSELQMIIAVVLQDNPSLFLKASSNVNNSKILQDYLLNVCLEYPKIFAKKDEIPKEYFAKDFWTKEVNKFQSSNPNIALRDASSTKADLIKLIQQIRSINPNLLIMVDHEGGRVWRFQNGFTKLPSAKVLGDQFIKLQNDPKQQNEFLKTLSDYGFLLAKELLEVGIDLSLTPVVDLDGPSNVIGKLERAYHSDPEIIAKITEFFIRGMNEAGMPATLKHYPGHGSCILDSHLEKPMDNRSIAELEKDLAPFKMLIAKPDLQFAIMAAHVTYPAIDKENTAGFSKKWICNILRNGENLDTKQHNKSVNAKFLSVVMSDCLNMKGADIGTPDKRIMASQAAGCDFQMCTHQRGSDLDILLNCLDKIPDDKLSAERRKTFASKVNRAFVNDTAAELRLARAKASLISSSQTITSTNANLIHSNTSPVVTSALNQNSTTTTDPNNIKNTKIIKDSSNTTAASKK